jgi:hypothetical protein
MSKGKSSRYLDKILEEHKIEIGIEPINKINENASIGKSKNSSKRRTPLKIQSGLDLYYSPNNDETRVENKEVKEKYEEEKKEKDLISLL